MQTTQTENTMHHANSMSAVSITDAETLAKRYMQIQQEIAALEQEKERIRDSLVKTLDGKVPERWHSTIDGKPVVIIHCHKTVVRYNESLLKERLGDRYVDILEIDAVKVRKNRELVRSYVAPVLETIGTPNAARVKASIQKGLIGLESFAGAFKKTSTPYISIRSDPSFRVSTSNNNPY